MKRIVVMLSLFSTLSCWADNIGLGHAREPNGVKILILVFMWVLVLKVANLPLAEQGQKKKTQKKKGKTDRLLSKRGKK